MKLRAQPHSEPPANGSSYSSNLHDPFERFDHKHEPSDEDDFVLGKRTFQQQVKGVPVQRVVAFHARRGAPRPTRGSPGLASSLFSYFAGEFTDRVARTRRIHNGGALYRVHNTRGKRPSDQGAKGSQLRVEDSERRSCKDYENSKRNATRARLFVSEELLEAGDPCF